MEKAIFLTLILAGYAGFFIGIFAWFTALFYWGEEQKNLTLGQRAALVLGLPFAAVWADDAFYIGHDFRPAVIGLAVWAVMFLVGTLLGSVPNHHIE